MAIDTVPALDPHTWAALHDVHVRVDLLVEVVVAPDEGPRSGVVGDEDARPVRTGPHDVREPAEWGAMPPANHHAIARREASPRIRPSKTSTREC